MLKNKFIKNGFEFIDHSLYLNENNFSSLYDLKKMFDLELAIDQDCSFRKRAYLKLEWNREADTYKLSDNQFYFQTSNSNVVDGGKIRQFKVMDKNILKLNIIGELIRNNLDMIRDYPKLKAHQRLVIGMHFIRYLVEKNSASYSSPDWLHKDDEPLVFIHLIGLSRHAWGGDNLIADENKKITHVIRLENELDTLVLNKSIYHAVTPLGSREGKSTRDVILFTIEPNYTQIANKDIKVA